MILPVNRINWFSWPRNMGKEGGRLTRERRDFDGRFMVSESFYQSINQSIN